MSTTQHDDYLWDRSGPADPAIVALEETLAAYGLRKGLRVAHGRRHGSSPPLHATRVSRRRSPWRVAIAAVAAVVLLLGAGGWYQYRLLWPQAQPWEVTSISGEVRVDGLVVDSIASLAPGSVLETGAATVRLQAARIGEVVVGEGSRFEILQTRSGFHRTQLRRGHLWARVWAPPGAFGVATPAGDIYDLGCEFLLRTDADGSGQLTVRSGWVQIDSGWREVLVPQGARIDFRAGGEPGIPYDLGARGEFLAALRDLDAQGRTVAADGDAVRRLLAAARPQDAISLLSLLQAHPRLADGPLYDRLAGLMPADALVTRAAIRAQGAQALSPWWDRLPYPRIKRWWLQWPDAFAGQGDAEALLREQPR
jgi:hypothetical protein